MQKLSKAQTTLGIAFVVLIWGLCWPVYKLALQYTPPLLYSGLRTLLGGIILGLLLLPQWRKIEWKKTWPMYFILAFFNIIIFNGVQTIGLQYLPEGLFSVIVYLQPVLVVLLAWAWLKEPLTILKVVGLIIGFIGVAVIGLEGLSGNISVLGIVLAIITSVGWAIGVVYVKKIGNQVHGLWLVSLQSIIGGLVLTGLGAKLEDVTSIVWNLPNLFYLLFGGLLGMAAATAVYFKLMVSGEANKVASFTFLVPLIAVAIGTIFLHEPFNVSLVEGLVLILISIFLINRPSRTSIKSKKSAA